MTIFDIFAFLAYNSAGDALSEQLSMKRHLCSHGGSLRQMSKFSLNPLKWLKRESKPAEPPPIISSPLLKPAAQPRKSGNIFMQLITLHKNLQSMELACRQGIDPSSFVRKASDQIALLKREAEMVGEEELAQGAGQLLAYLDTVSECRLDLDEEGVKVMRDFIIIFKDAMGDAAPGLRILDSERLEMWNSRYQSLMARMKPIENEIDISDLDADVAAVKSDEDVSISTSVDEPVQEAIEAYGQVQDELAESKPALDFPSGGELGRQSDQEPSEEAVEETPADDVVSAGVSTPDSLPPYETDEELHVSDVVISDAEIKSAREFMELGEPKPELARKADDAGARTVAPLDARGAFKNNGDDGTSVKSPVQLEEVERLKKKLLELHEKQEMLSSKMTGILGGLKKVVKAEQKPAEPPSVEELGVDQLEDIIFAGRKKG